MVSIGQMLNIRLSESDCFSAWVMGANVKLDTATPDLKCKRIYSVIFLLLNSRDRDDLSTRDKIVFAP